MSRPDLLHLRVARGLRHTHNWIELAKFTTVGAIGYVVNLTVYTLLLRRADVHYLGAATGSFLVAVTNNYLLNRFWTFRHRRGHFAYQGLRFFVVALIALSANLLVLRVLVAVGVGKILAQAVAIVLVTPLNFLGNKLWSFRRH